MLNVPSPGILEVTIMSDGRKMVIKDSKGECLFRAASIVELRVLDCRHGTPTGEELKSQGRAFLNWGEEICTVHNNLIPRRECRACWDSLKSDLEDSEDK